MSVKGFKNVLGTIFIILLILGATFLLTTLVLKWYYKI